MLQLEGREIADFIVCLKLEHLIVENQMRLLATYAQNYLLKNQLIELQNQQKAWCEGIHVLPSSLELTKLPSTIIDKH